MADTTLLKRPPVVVVMGHVDHGKTTLLDYIRKSNVASKEAGGITQAVGAYEIDHKGQKITFIDTPGHEAFTKMRSRGATIADIAILVVGADDSVSVQTKEAIRIIKTAKLPYIVAINKVDKNTADVDRVKNDLLQAEVLLEGFGGSISFQPVSAKTGQGVEELLDLITLTAEVENLTYDPSVPAQGYVLEANTDKRVGLTATVIIKNGTLHAGDQIQAGNASGKIKGLKDFLGAPVKELAPSAPAIILGFENLPTVGDAFVTGSNVSGKESGGAVKTNIPTPAGDERKKINFVIKGISGGAVEALADAITKLSAPLGSIINIVSQGVGDISDNEAKLAVATNSFVVAYKVGITAPARALAQAHKLNVFESDIIYKLLEDLEAELTGRRKQLVAGELEVLAVFNQTDLTKQIIGGKVTTGEILNHSEIEVRRRGVAFTTGTITNLQQSKKDAASVPEGLECGMLVKAEKAISVGDQLIIRML